MSTTTSVIPCRHFLRGRCTHENCRFSHTVNALPYAPRIGGQPAQGTTTLAYAYNNNYTRCCYCYWGRCFVLVPTTETYATVHCKHILPAVATLLSTGVFEKVEMINKLTAQVQRPLRVWWNEVVSCLDSVMDAERVLSGAAYAEE